MGVVIAIIFLLAPALSVAASSIQVSDARTLELPDGTRIVLTVSGPVEHQGFILDNPPRLVLDLKNARLGASPSQSNLRTSDVRGLRTGIQNGADLRIVLDLNYLARFETSVERAPYRDGYLLVVDLFRLNKPTSLPTLISISQNQAPPVLSPPAIPEIKPVVRVPSPPKPHKRNFIIALDPGHGGKDPGATGARGTLEKDVVLDIARHLKALIDKEPGMRAILTRDSDRYLQLRERIAIARRHRADMFISIHADAYTHADAHGSSVFILSPKGASSEAARWLADKENAADLAGGVIIKDRDEEIARVLLDLSQEATLEASMLLAEKVLAELAMIGDVHKSRVERAGFVVLKSPDIPSILVETAFITNPKEESKLRSARHQRRLAQAVLNGVREYYRSRPLQQQLLAAVEAPPEPDLPASPTPQVQPPAPQVRQSFQSHPASQIHIIQRGESLADVAQRYQISVSNLKAANGLNSNQLRMPAGTELTIPVSGS